MTRTYTFRWTVTLAALLLACGSTGSAVTGAAGAGGGGTGGSAGQGGDSVPGNDASVEDAPVVMDVARPDRIVTCEGRDGNACMVDSDAQACRRCIQSCCCDPIAACRADAACAPAIGTFNDCIQQGNAGLSCLVVAVESLADASLFAAIADCVDMECGDLTCPL